MTPTQREAALRLAYLLNRGRGDDVVYASEAAALLRELAAEPVQEATPSDMAVYGAIAANYEPVQEPVAMLPMICRHSDRSDCALFGANPPQQRKPLTDAEVQDLKLLVVGTPGFTVEQLVRAIEAAHGIKETP